WLQSYLDLSENRATWAYVADALIAQNIPNKYHNIEETSKINIFLQSWKTQASKLPKDLKDMIGVAKKYGARLEGLTFSQEIIKGMPAWYHIEATDTTRMYKGRYSECLRKNHGVQTVGDLETEAQKICTARHSRRRNCRCVECVADRARRCNSPFKCYTRANEILRTLPPKWNPATEQPEELRGELDGHQEDGATFDNRITVEGTLADAFRIFTEGTTTNALPDIQQGHDEVAEESIVYTDGSCINNGNEDARAGAGIFCPSNEDLNRAIRLPEGIPQTNQSGKILSIMEAAK
ncbi:hypothetical protein FB446DRAFT_837179, partial [Lentinula raphanica]